MTAADVRTLQHSSAEVAELGLNLGPLAEAGLTGHLGFGASSFWRVAGESVSL